MTVSIEHVLTFDPEQAVGQLFGARYRIDRVLATGGMGLLFAGTDERANRPVAIKLLKPQDGLDERRVRRFLREVELAAQLRHPHIVDVLDLGSSEDGRAPYLVMELMSGRSLQTELDARGRLTPAEALAFLLPIMDALARVHAAHVVHRDIKPANIFLHRSAYGSIVPKLIDFGIAKVQGQGLETLTGGLFGTPAYMAPEQLADGEIGPWTDVWAMGAVFYRCLNGAPPFVGSTSAEVIAKIATASAPPLYIEGIKRSLGAAVDRALVRRPELRYGSMRAFSAAIVASARSAGIEVVVPPSLEPDLESVTEEPTEREERPRSPSVWGRFGVGRKLLLALAFLIPACSAVLLLRDSASTASAGDDRRAAANARSAAAAPPVAPGAAPTPAGGARPLHGAPRSTESTALMEQKPRGSEPARERLSSRSVRRAAKPTARPRARVVDEPTTSADAGLQLLVEW